ncbi:MAG: hypothetical protein ACFE8L_09555 [Candidatus Hodarchaeota archaeon]
MSMLEEVGLKIKKVKCPMCGKKFVPKFFHREKVKYEFGSTIYRIKFPKFKNSNEESRPNNIIRRSWVTFCPKCKYIIKFAAEVGKKEMLAKFSSFLHLKEFKENGNIYEYNFYNYEKPYKETLYYNEILMEGLKKSILNTLEDLKLEDWGKLYKMWKSEKIIDSFKFLIKFYSLILKYIEIPDIKISNGKYSEQIKKLDISEDLMKDLLEIKILRNKVVYEYYDLNEVDEKFIQKIFVNLVFDFIFKKLVQLGLNSIYNKKDVDIIDNSFLYSELRKIFKNYLEEQLGLGEYANEFVISLLNKLKITLS